MWDQLKKKKPLVSKGPSVAPTKVTLPNNDDTISKLDAAMMAVDEEERRKKEEEEETAREKDRYSAWSSCRC